MDTLFQDLRYAARMLAKNPGFAALTTLCLALGIGVNSTIFSVVDTVAIRPLPFRDPDTLVALYSTHQVNGIDRGNVSYRDLQDWRARARVFAEMASVTGRSLTLSDGDEPERFNGATISANMFPMLGIQPILGRQIRPEEDTPGGSPVIILSHGVWQRRYASDPSVVGRTITVNGVRSTVIAVMPPKFQFPERAQLWIPQAPIEHTSLRVNRNLEVIARLKPGVELNDARSDIKAVGDRLARDERDDQGWSASAGSTPVRRMIVAEALTYLERLSRDPAGDDALRLDLARGYHKVGDVQGKPSVPNLGDREGALASYRRALVLIRPLRSGPLAAEAATELTQLDIALAGVLFINGAGDEARAALAEAVDSAERLVRSKPSDDAARRLLGSAYFQVAAHEDPVSALAEWSKAGAIFDALLAERPDDADRQRNVALVQKYIGDRYEDEEEFEKALPHHARALELDEKRLAGNPSNRAAQFDVAVDLSGVGRAKHLTGHLAEAIPYFERCLRIREQLSASDPKDVQARRLLKTVHDRLGRLYADMGRLADALDQHRTAVAIAESLAAVDAVAKDDLAVSLFDLGVAEAQAGRKTAACNAYRRSLTFEDDLLRSGGLPAQTERRVRVHAASARERLAGCK